MDIETITRREALLKGLSRFYTGKLCRRGHDSPRYVRSGQCIKCQSDAQKVYYRALSQRQLVVRVDLPVGFTPTQENELFGIMLAYGSEQAYAIAERDGTLAVSLTPQLQQNLATVHRAPKQQPPQPRAAYLGVQGVRFEGAAPMPPEPIERGVTGAALIERASLLPVPENDDGAALLRQLEAL